MMKVGIEICNTCVVGTGAAGYNAAIRLKTFGSDRVVMVTEGVTCGTSRNTGSDKQTYYKLGLAGGTPDSVARMAGDLFACGSTDGDNALCEAALSARCFFALCELGVPFPSDRFGQFVGYKTDHDPSARATSAGPLTSKFMTECLERRAAELKIEIFDGLTAVEILKKGGEVCGLVAVGEDGITVFQCKNVIWATGGPAGIYADTVYPVGHHGSSGVVFEAGAHGQNLTEWQYGLASTAPRWNVSGTYMQVLPRFVSVDGDGVEREFLTEFFTDPGELLSMVFLKGYQWPFDCKKVAAGSSVIDLLVYREEILRGRRVYLDYRTNPFGAAEVDYASLSPEARTYLEKAHACFGTPIDRLEHMNTPAVELYRSRGVDLHTEMLPVSLCAQHNNGGAAVDAWWQTAVPGLFVCGEAAGTHGVTRPGGSALNAGQVGSLRAAQYAAARRPGVPERDDAFPAIAEAAAKKHADFLANAAKQPDNAAEKLRAAQERMSRVAGAIRDADGIEAAIRAAKDELSRIGEVGGSAVLVCRYRDTLISQIMVLSAMADFARRGIGSRGSCLFRDAHGSLREGLGEEFRFSPASEETKQSVQEVVWNGGSCGVTVRPVRPIPDEDIFFENVWKTFRENGNVY